MYSIVNMYGKEQLGHSAKHPLLCFIKKTNQNKTKHADFKQNE